MNNKKQKIQIVQKQSEKLCRVAGKANLTENTKRHALSIMDKVTKKKISAGKDPMGLAASVLYISCPDL